ncbi:hypothetical protein ACLOJK_040211 [Asimina triloba]
MMVPHHARLVIFSIFLRAAAAGFLDGGAMGGQQVVLADGMGSWITIDPGTAGGMPINPGNVVPVGGMPTDPRIVAPGGGMPTDPGNGGGMPAEPGNVAPGGGMPTDPGNVEPGGGMPTDTGNVVPGVAPGPVPEPVPVQPQPVPGPIPPQPVPEPIPPQPAPGPIAPQVPLPAENPTAPLLPVLDQQQQPTVAADGGKAPDYETAYKGGWELVSQNSGVSAMHMQLMYNNKAIFFDATTLSPAATSFPPGHCRPDPKDKTKEDCWVHAVEYDINTAAVRNLRRFTYVDRGRQVLTNPWCASGALSPDGVLVQTGGWNDGGGAVRYMDTCPTCDWEEYPTALAAQRWYSTQQILPDNRYILIGGRRQFNYEYVPAKGESNSQTYELPLLRETTDPVENNLYPFVHLSPDGRVFVFANNRSILLDPNSNTVVSEFPVLNGGARNYPGSGMSVLLPLRLRGGRVKVVPAEVLVCGGASPTAPRFGAKGNFIPALRSCGRITITAMEPKWKMELMPEPRVMGDMLLLPNTDVLMINGAKRGCAGWGFAADPNFEPVLYRPKKPRKERFVTLSPTTIPRMYHSTSAVLPDGRVLVAGSNTHNRYVFEGPYPSELRVEKFSPPYLDPALAGNRPKISGVTGVLPLKYGQVFPLTMLLSGEPPKRENVRVTMYAPPFTTHGYSMNQRLLVLQVTDVVPADVTSFTVSAVAPPTPALAPSGYYLLYILNRGLPSDGIWARIAP